MALPGAQRAPRSWPGCRGRLCSVAVPRWFAGRDSHPLIVCTSTTADRSATIVTHAGGADGHRDLAEAEPYAPVEWLLGARSWLRAAFFTRYIARSASASRSSTVAALPGD